MIAAFTFLTLLAVPTLEQDLQSPCPNVFMYEPPGTESDRWYGEVNLTTDRTLHMLWMNIVLDGKAEILGNWVGDVTTRDNIDFRIENKEKKIYPDSAVPVRFFVRYNTRNKIPRLRNIKLYGKEICNTNTPDIPNQSPNTRPDTNKPDIVRPVNFPSWFNNDDGGDIPQDLARLTGPERTTEMPQLLEYSIDIRQDQCAKMSYNSVPLVVSGTLAPEGQWPWHIALFQNELDKIKYICGGSLVSHHHIITAAHCVQAKQDYLVYLGTHDLGAWSRSKGLQIKVVDDIIVHPGYNAATFYRDVAILKLREPVTFTNWVRPVCLWSSKTDLDNIVGKQGLVVGWGFDETDKVTQKLNLAVMPVVDQLTCVRSSEFFRQRTADTTFCAGFRNGTSVCNGDSGGGMVFKSGNTWYLRGVVSISTAREYNSKLCNPKQYVVFTDLAQFLPWIRYNVYIGTEF